MTFLAPGALAVPARSCRCSSSAYVWIVRRRAASAGRARHDGALPRPGRASRSAGGATCRRRCSSSAWSCCSSGWPARRRPSTCPRREGTVILAFDVSTSMKAKDLTPTRMAAAKQAARAFVADQPSSIKIGVVAFSDAGYVVQPPTRSKRDVLDAIDRLSAEGRHRARARDPHVAQRGRGQAARARPGRAGERRPATRGPLPRLGGGRPALRRREHRAARPAALAPVAAQAGVRIFPIGLGSPNGAVVDVDGFQVATALDDDAAPRGRRAAAAARTSRADDAGDAAAGLRHASTSSSRSPGARPRSPRSSRAAGCSCFLVAAGLSMRWYGRVV